MPCNASYARFIFGKFFTSTIIFICATICTKFLFLQKVGVTDGQDAGYFLRTLQTVLLTLGSSEPPLFIGTPRLLRGNSYLWCVWVVIYERPMTDRIHRIRQVLEAPAPRWTFEAGMREATREALVVLRHEADERMEYLQYRHFPS
jgi:hypothetical protein